MPWIVLMAAGFCEVAWVIGLRYSAGLSRLWPSAFVIAAMLMSFVLLAKASKSIPPPIAYAVWVGIGVLGAWTIGVVWLREPFRPVQLLFVGLVLAGVIGLKLSSEAPPPPEYRSPGPIPADLAPQEG